MSDLGDIQRAVGEVLIPEARTAQSSILPEDDAIGYALEFYFTVHAMKRAYQPGARLIARRFAERMGLDAEALEAFALQKIAEAVGDVR